MLDYHLCEKCHKEWPYEPTWNGMGGIHLAFEARYVCGGNIVKRPSSVKGTAGITKAKPTPGIKHVGGSLYHVQGSGASPYVIDLEGTDDRCPTKTPTCTCPNWKIERNKRLTSTGEFFGYNCKHVAEVLGQAKTKKDDSAMQKRKAAEAQKQADKILAIFKKGN